MELGKDSSAERFHCGIFTSLSVRSYPTPFSVTPGTVNTAHREEWVRTHYALCRSFSFTDPPFTLVPRDPENPTFPSNGFFSVLPTVRISDCPKLPEKLEIDGRDVSANECSFIL